MMPPERRGFEFLRASSLYTKSLSGASLLIVGLLVTAFAHAVFEARHYGPSDVQASSKAVFVAMFLVMFTVALWLHRWRVRQLLLSHQIDDAVLREMTSILISLTGGFCILSVLMLHQLT
jgi:hypothetical protein